MLSSHCLFWLKISVFQQSVVRVYYIFDVLYAKKEKHIPGLCLKT